MLKNFLTKNDSNASPPELYLNTVFPKYIISSNNVNYDYIPNIKLTNKSDFNTINQTETAERTDYYTNATGDNIVSSTPNRNSSSSGKDLFLPYLQNYNVGKIRESENNKENLNKLTRLNNNLHLNIEKINK